MTNKTARKMAALAALCCTLCGAAATPADEESAWELRAKAGVAIGGACPMPIPRQIRSIESYNPLLNGTLEGAVTRRLGKEKRWGVTAGLRLEQRGMKTRALVKSYSVEITEEDGSRVAGYWSGQVHTRYHSLCLALPVAADYRLNARWSVNGGLYVATLIDGEFGGKVRDGYLREGAPTGERVDFAGDKEGRYNFDDKLRRLQWGAQAGGEWRASRHLLLWGELTWGLNDIFPQHFKTITFTLHPIYANVGVGYRF